MAKTLPTSKDFILKLHQSVLLPDVLDLRAVHDTLVQGVIKAVRTDHMNIIDSYTTIEETIQAVVDRFWIEIREGKNCPAYIMLKIVSDLQNILRTMIASEWRNVKRNKQLELALLRDHLGLMVIDTLNPSTGLGVRTRIQEHAKNIAKLFDSGHLQLSIYSEDYRYLTTISPLLDSVHRGMKLISIGYQVVDDIHDAWDLGTDDFPIKLVVLPNVRQELKICLICDNLSPVMKNFIVKTIIAHHEIWWVQTHFFIEAAIGNWKIIQEQYPDMAKRIKTTLGLPI